MHDGDRQRVSSELHAAVAGLAPYEVEYRTVAPDGRVRWVAAKGVTITQIGSGPYMMIGVVQDITRRKEAENLLRQREALFRSIAEGIPAIVWTARADGVFEYFNSRACEYTGISPEQSGGGSMFIWDSVHSDDIASAREAWRWAVATREPYHLESRLRSAAGEYRWFLWHAVPVNDGESDIVRWYGTFTDIHDRKQAEEEVREINAHLEQRVQSRTAQLEAANKELEAFAYSVSHDLRAPLRGIDGWSMALLEDYGGRLDDNAHQYLDRVRSETQRMGILIDDLLQLSRITRVEMRFEPVDLSALAASIAARLREAEPHRDFDFAIAPGLTANGDTRLLEVALTNLLSNAAKFTGPCAQARIELGKTGSNGELAFYVRDNGVGFDMAYAHMLFGAFQRLHKTSEFPGTGIGLAIVQRVIGRHGGRVWADAQPGHGATFYFAFAPPAVAQGAPSGP
jgi:PAS domain S-box-containing protein